MKKNKQEKSTNIMNDNKNTSSKNNFLMNEITEILSEQEEIKKKINYSK